MQQGRDEHQLYQLSTGTSACSGRSQGPLVALWCSNHPIFAFLPRAGRALANTYATSNIVALPSIAHQPTVSAK
eukprot:IDg7901t1